MNGKAALRDWLLARQWDIAGELTFKDGTSYEKANRIMNYYWGIINTLLYKNGFKRHNKQVERVVFRHGDGKAQNNHFHFAVRVPSDRNFDIDEFVWLLAQAWRENCGGNYITNIDKINDTAKNISYISRYVTNKECDSFEVLSSHIAAN
jgi:hypothetical protein